MCMWRLSMDCVGGGIECGVWGGLCVGREGRGGRERRAGKGWGGLREDRWGGGQVPAAHPGVAALLRGGPEHGEGGGGGGGEGGAAGAWRRGGGSGRGAGREPSSGEQGEVREEGGGEGGGGAPGGVPSAKRRWIRTARRSGGGAGRVGTCPRGGTAEFVGKGSAHRERGGGVCVRATRGRVSPRPTGGGGVGGTPWRGIHPLYFPQRRAGQLRGAGSEGRASRVGRGGQGFARDRGGGGGGGETPGWAGGFEAGGGE
ncbi:hypothetical protein FKM82_012523 [Ascaphus truei]